jgi:hypothetical protein
MSKDAPFAVDLDQQAECTARVAPGADEAHTGLVDTGLEAARIEKFKERQQLCCDALDCAGAGLEPRAVRAE